MNVQVLSFAPDSFEDSWNVRCRGTKVPQERMFQGVNVPRNESSPRNENSTGAKVLSVDFSLPGTKVQRNEKAYIRHIPEEYNNIERRAIFCDSLVAGSPQW